MRSVTEIQNDERLWTVRDVAHYLAKGKSWVYEQAGASKLPSLRIGAELRFDPEVVKRWARGGSALISITKK